MKLATVEIGGRRTVALVEGEKLWDLCHPSGVVPGPEIPPDMVAFIALGEAGMQRALETRRRAGEERALPRSAGRLLAPIQRPRKNVFCVGRNYREHLAETAALGVVVREDAVVPTFFTKPPTAVIGPEEAIPWDPEVSDQLDWEVELAVVVGRPGRNIRAAEAHQHVFGYTIVIDVSARDLQQRHGQWFKGKALDGSCPMGPVIVTADEIPDPQRLRLQLRVNGVTKQDANTAAMIFDVAAIIESLSAGLTLEPGDVIATGTPSGVGFARTPPEFLQPGDVVEAEIEGIGILRNRVERCR